MIQRRTQNYGKYLSIRWMKSKVDGNIPYGRGKRKKKKKPSKFWTLLKSIVLKRNLSGEEGPNTCEFCKEFRVFINENMGLFSFPPFFFSKYLKMRISYPFLLDHSEGSLLADSVSSVRASLLADSMCHLFEEWGSLMVWSSSYEYVACIDFFYLLSSYFKLIIY